jgi:hypothetical protein
MAAALQRRMARVIIKGLKIILTKKDRGGFIFGDCPKGNLSPYPGQSSKV